MSAPPRRAAERKGHWAETQAALLLRLKGYRIIERRFRSRAGEIDLIARRGRRLAFVEVKARRTLDQAAWAVTPRQQARIARAAEHWLAIQGETREFDMSFDVVLVAPWTWPRHIASAFRV
jgi:putative endonuclease